MAMILKGRCVNISPVEKTNMMIKNEKGALIVESTLVFPIMFFVLFFLIYMGNMMYMRSRVDSIVSDAAVEAAAYCADPYLSQVMGGVPGTINDVKPYHNLLGNSSLAVPIRNKMMRRINSLGSGFFSGMGLSSVTVNKFDYKKGLITSTFTVDVSYRIRFPIKFIGEEKSTILLIHSSQTVPVTDTGEFILDVDMAVDFMQQTGIDKKLNDMMQKIQEFFS